MAGTQSMHWGSVIRASDDFGATWSAPDRQNVRFPEDSGLALANIWQLRPGRADEPDTVYCGVEPAALFESTDAGETWSPVDGLLNHEHRPQWQPGGGGLCLHTIVLDPADRAADGRRHLHRRLLPHGRRRAQLAGAQRGACGRSSCRTSTPSSASACTRW